MASPIYIDKEGDRVVIIQRGKGAKVENMLYLAIQDMWEEGYRFPKEPGGYDISVRNFRGTRMGRAVMYKEPDTPEKTQDKESEKKPATKKKTEAGQKLKK